MDVYEKCVVGTLQSCSALIDPEKRVRGSSLSAHHQVKERCVLVLVLVILLAHVRVHGVVCLFHLLMHNVLQKSTRGRSRDLYLKGLLEAHATVSRSINPADFRL